MRQDTLEGGCLCGAMRYKVGGKTGPMGHCHCAMCRKSTGGTVVTWTTCETEKFRWTRGQPTIYQSSQGIERSFCGKCGASLTYWRTAAPQYIEITLGTLDNPEDHPAEKHIWTDSKLPWLTLDKKLPSFKGGPER